MKRLLIWNFSQLEGERSNLGDKAIFASMVTDIRSAMPNTEIVAISSNPEYTVQQYRVTAVHIKKINRIWKAVRQADLVVLGGGEFIQDESSLPYLLLNLSIGVLAILLGKPIMFYAIGVASRQEISTLGRFLVRLILNKARLITVRDEESMITLRKLGVVQPPTYVTADPALSLSSSPKKRTDEILTKRGIIKDKKIWIGFSPRRILHTRFNLLPLGIQMKLNLASRAYHTQNRKLARVLSQVADSLVDDLNADIIFIPMYTGTNFSHRDHEFAFNIVKNMRNKKRAKVISDVHSPQEIQGIVGKMDMVIGMTLHSLILAANMGVPFIAISSSSKMDRFMQRMREEARLFSDYSIDPNGLLTEIRITLNKKHEIKRKLRKRVEELRKHALLNNELLRALLS